MYSDDHPERTGSLNTPLDTVRRRRMTRFGFTNYLVGSVVALAIACGGSQPPPVPTEAPPAPAPAPDAAPQPAAAAPAPAKKVEAITKAPYGKVDGQDVELYTLTNKNGLVMKVTNYGVIVTEFWVPDKAGKLADIVGGY